MIIRYILISSSVFAFTLSYSHRWRSSIEDSKGDSSLRTGCKPVSEQLLDTPEKLKGQTILYINTEPDVDPSPEDPILEYNSLMPNILFGNKTFADGADSKTDLKLDIVDNKSDDLGQFPSGKIMRAELFQDYKSVHLPMPEFMQKGHCYLKESLDYMQTAVDAFSIFLHGNLDDIHRLPSSYVLRSARTIAMMKIAREKLAATWTVVKGDRDPEEIPFGVLQMYRPLFKYLNGREIARLNLSDSRILTYIGTHADLDRHQVGVVASNYIRQNPEWEEPKYLNQMNNLLCGVPMTFMRKIPENTYLQLTHQVFYHIRACDPLQRRFYLTMMTKTQALGKSYSWSARDVSRLGLLLSEVEGPDLAAVNPEAMSGITAQVMLEIPPASLKHITEMQLRYIGQKPLNILAKRLRAYQDQLRTISKGNSPIQNNFITILLAVLYVVYLG